MLGFIDGCAVSKSAGGCGCRRAFDLSPASMGVSTAVAHITFASKTGSKPVLQFFSEERSEPRRVTIETNPFCIGRSETADLRIDSAQVSREHAEIFERRGMWFLRDLGSTNGTEVNGQQVSETVLTEGDIIRFVDIELTFLGTGATQFQRMVTQPAAPSQKAAPAIAIPPEVAAARRAIEVALWQALPIEIAEIYSLKSCRAAALVALETNPLSTTSADAPFFHHRATACCEQLFRMRAVEMGKEVLHRAEVPRGTQQRLFVPVESCETLALNSLGEVLSSLRSLAPIDWQLGVTLSTAVALDRWKLDDLSRVVREYDLLLALDNFQGTGTQVAQLEACPIDYLFLDHSMLEGIAASRQPARRLQSVGAACQALEIQPVLPMGISDDSLHLCQEVGYDLVLRIASTPAAAPATRLPLSCSTNL